MDFFIKFCACCASFCTLYKDIEISINSRKSDQYILLEEFTPYSTDTEEFFEPQEYENQDSNTRLAREFGMKMLSKYDNTRTII